MTRKRFFSIFLSAIMVFSAVTVFDLAFTQSSIIAYAAGISAPSVTASNASYKSVKLSWKKVKGAKKYIVLRSDKKSSGYKTIKTVAKNTYTDTKATCGKTYYYKVTAVKGSTKKTSKPVKIKCTPAKVSGVNATSTACSDVTVTFKKVSGASGYDVSYCSNKEGEYKSVALINSTSYTHSIGVGNTGYYKVRAYRTVNSKKVYGPYSSVSSVTALNHSYSDWITTSASTCTSKGIQSSICVICGDVQYQELPMVASHSYGSYIVEKSPTCGADGTKYIICSICGDKQYATMPATNEHLYSLTTKEATCTEDGEIKKSCKNCDKVVSTPIKAKGHSYNKITVAPTCTEQGYDKFTCSACGDTYQNNFTTVAPHSYGSYVVEKSATCGEAGTKYTVCSICGDKHYDVIPATGEHSYITVSKDASCTEQGYDEYTCKVCGDSFKNNYTNPLGHSFTNYASDNNATCTSNSTQTAKCDRCDLTDTKELPDTKLQHKFDGTAVSNDNGTHKAYCSYDCGNYEIIDCEYSYAVITAPTYTSNGVGRYTCFYCGYSYDEEIPAVICDHSDTTVINNKDSTCTENGYTGDLQCNICKTIIQGGTVIPKKGHNYVTTLETCTTDSHRECSVCGETDPDYTIIPAHHNYVTTAETCTTDSHRECSVCGVVDMDYTPIPAKGHNYVTTPETCTESSHRECSVCGVVDMDYTPIPAKGHNYVTTAETCTTDSHRECSVCGEDDPDYTIIPAHHNYVTTAENCTTDSHRECSVCGTVDTEYTPVPAKGHTVSTNYVVRTDEANATHLYFICPDCKEEIETDTFCLDITGVTADSLAPYAGIAEISPSGHKITLTSTKYIDKFELSGSANDITISVDAFDDAEVKLCGVTIINSTASVIDDCIRINDKCTETETSLDSNGNPITEKVVPTVSISAKDGTVNTLKAAVAGGNAVQSETKLEFKGHGTLNMETVSTAVDARAKLYIRNLTMNITSSNRGIDTKIETKNAAGQVTNTDYANVSFGANANVKIISIDDGIRCKNMVFEALDTVLGDTDTIVSITSGGDAIQLEGKKGLTMNQGHMTLKGTKSAVNEKSGLDTYKSYVASGRITIA